MISYESYSYSTKLLCWRYERRDGEGISMFDWRIVFIIVLPPQGVIEVIRRKWAKMTPQEKAPYEAMEAAYQKSQMTEMKQVFPEYWLSGDVI